MYKTIQFYLLNLLFTAFNLRIGLPQKTKTNQQFIYRGPAGTERN